MKVSNKEFLHYDIELLIEPEDQSLRSVVDIKLPSSRLKNQISFYLHKQLQVLDLTCENLDNFVVDDQSPSGIQFMPDARRIDIEIQEPIISDILNFHIEYQGVITEWPEWSANVISAEWTELGFYFPWFPYNAEFGEFTYKIKVRAPDKYIVYGVGDKKKEDSTWFVESNKPMSDLVITVSKHGKVQSSNISETAFEFSYMSLSDTTAQIIINDMVRCLDFYTNWFGKTDQQSLTLIESAREMGGGYARKGVIVLGGLNDAALITNHEAYVRYFAHEAAHLWWHNASTTTWEDWLNESFAEFSALLVIRELFGEDSYQKRLLRKIESSVNAEIIWGFNRSDISSEEKRTATENALYAKGPVILDRLNSLISKEKFLPICQRMIEEKIDSTVQMLVIIKEVISPKIAQWLENQLRTF